jgi:hypothetical protein
LQLLLPPAVLLERRVCVVIAAAVSFDDEARITPKEVGLDPPTTNLKLNVHLWLRKAGSLAHPEKPPLQFAASSLFLRMEFIEEKTKPSNPSTAPTTAKQGMQSS